MHTQPPVLTHPGKWIAIRSDAATAVNHHSHLGAIVGRVTIDPSRLRVICAHLSPPDNSIKRSASSCDMAERL
jgi:hypothetical protein